MIFVFSMKMMLDSLRAAGEKTLIDQLRGGNNYRTGNWPKINRKLV